MGTGLRLRLTHASLAGPLPPADLYLDCRMLPHPPTVEYDASERSLRASDDGDDPGTQAWMEAHGAMGLALLEAVILAALDTLPARRPQGMDRPCVVCCLCREGRYRSSAAKHILGRRLSRTWCASVEVA